MSRVKTLQSKSKARNSRLLKTYGITLDQYSELLEKQNHQCAVCCRHSTEFKTNLSVDHDHKTLAIRGLLCTFCNRYVIGRHTDPLLMYSAGIYLSQSTGLFVPKPKRRKRKNRAKR